jgi:hypothetical protein
VGLYRLVLTQEQIGERINRRDPKTRPRVQHRLEMVRLASLGWRIPLIARHCPLTQSGDVENGAETGRVKWINRCDLAEAGFSGLLDDLVQCLLRVAGR